MIPVTTKGRTNLFSLSLLSALPHVFAALIIEPLMVWTMEPLGPEGLEALGGSGGSGDSVVAGVGTIGGADFGGAIAAVKHVSTYYI